MRTQIKKGVKMEKFIRTRSGNRWINSSFIYAVNMWDNGEDDLVATKFFLKIESISGEETTIFNSEEERNAFIISSGLGKYLG